MQIELDFDAPRAKSRTSDQPTSALAAERIESTGAATAHRALCLAEVRRLPGQTAAEIAAATNLERHEPSRRLPELRRAGLVKNGPSRKCGVTGNPSITWEPK